MLDSAAPINLHLSVKLQQKKHKSNGGVVNNALAYRAKSFEFYGRVTPKSLPKSDVYSA